MICFNDWAIYVLYSVSKDNLVYYLKNINCPILFINQCLENIKDIYGFTYSNKSIKKSILYLNKHNSILDFINTISHESSHITTHINSNLNDEQRSKIIGNLSEQIFSKFVLEKFKK